MNKRDDILNAAFELLAEGGDIASLNMRKTATRAGCAHTNVYNYFSSFEALKWAMLERALEKLHDFMFDLPPGRHDALQLISRYIDFALENPAVYRLIWVSNLDPAAAPEDTAFLHRISGKISGIAPEPEADLLHSYVHGKLLNIIFNRTDPGDVEKQKDRMLEVCRKVLG